MPLAVYSLDEKLGGSFVKNTKATIQGLAEVAQESDKTILARTTTAYPSRAASAVTLMYHHCIVQATRPLVMCLLKGFLAPTECDQPTGTWVSPPIVALLKTSISSALTTLKILGNLNRQRLLGKSLLNFILILLWDEDTYSCFVESFLPFDLEYAFASATLLYVVQTILPGFVEDDSSWRSMANSLIDIMITKGSIIAGLRKSELRYLQQILTVLRPSGEVTEVDGGIICPVAVAFDGDPISESHSIYSSLWSSEFGMENMNTDSDHLFDLVAQLGTDSEADIIGNL